MFASSLFLGNFVGPTLAGFLVEKLEFAKASVVFWSFFVLIFTLNTTDLIYQVKNGYSAKAFRNGYEAIMELE